MMCIACDKAVQEARYTNGNLSLDDARKLSIQGCAMVEEQREGLSNSVHHRFFAYMPSPIYSLSSCSSTSMVTWIPGMTTALDRIVLMSSAPHVTQNVRLYMRSSKRCQLLVPSPHGDFLVVMASFLTGARHGPEIPCTLPSLTIVLTYLSTRFRSFPTTIMVYL